MLSTLIVGLILGVVSVVAQSSGSLSIVCFLATCLQGYSSITLGDTLSAQGLSSVHLLPGKYTSTTSPQLHMLLTSSSATLSSSPGFNSSSSVNGLSLNVALEPGIAFYSNTLFSGPAAFYPLPSSPINRSIPLAGSSLALSDNVWVALISASSTHPVILWDTVPDISQLPPEASLPLSLVNIQSSACSPPCSASGICNASSTCSCPTGFTGSACEACADGFFGPNCQPCPSNCETCDQGISGSGRCFAPIIGNAPATCNCVNGQCSADGTCTCNPGWTDAANGTACAQCAQGFYLTSTGDCRICQVGCSQCQDGTAVCTTCRSGFSQDENDPTLCDPVQQQTSAGIGCGDGSYGNGDRCGLCSHSCQTCNGPSSNNCITCPPSTSLFQGSCVATSSNGVCDGTNGMIVNNNYQECDTCGAKCTSCEIPNFNVASTISQVQCTGCLPGSFLSQGQCVGNCPLGTFVSPQDNLTCTACSSACSTCLGSADYCLTCANEQLASSGQCVSSCPSGTFSSSGACIQCHPDCPSCTGSSFNQCSACPAKRPVLSSGRCLPTCGQSEFFDMTSSACQDCDSSCSSCSGSGPNHCLACSSFTQVLLAGSCVPANCTGSSSNVIPNLGVCLSDLVQPLASTTVITTITSSSSSSSSSSVSRPSSTSESHGPPKGPIINHNIPWWLILSIVLGCVFILIFILLLWRWCARKQREKDTIMFASARHLDGGNGWRWRLQQFKNILLGEKKGGYDIDDPPMAHYGDPSLTHLDDVNLGIELRSPTTSHYLDDLLSPPPIPPRSIYRSRSSRRRDHSSMTRSRSTHHPSRRYRSGDISPPRGYRSDEPPLPTRHLSLNSSPRLAYRSNDPSTPRKYYTDHYRSPSIRRRPSLGPLWYDAPETSFSRYPQPNRSERSQVTSPIKHLSPPPSYLSPIRHT